MSTVIDAPAIVDIRREHDRWNRRWYIATLADGTERWGINVTGVTDVLSKGPLYQWGINTGVDAMAQQVGAYASKGFISFDASALSDMTHSAKKRPDEVRDEAADLGTRIHDYIEAVLTGRELPPLTPDMEPSVNAFWAWKAECGLELRVSERMLFSLTHNYGGTLDAIGYKPDGTKVILDWKSSNGIYESMALQTAAYWYADGEMTGEWAAEIYIARFPKVAKEGEAPFEVKQVTGKETAFNAFLNCLHLWNALKAPKRPALWA